MTDSSFSPVDVRHLVRRATHDLPSTPPARDNTTSELTIDEELNLHAIGWEPVELVSGISLFSTPAGLWNWGQGEIVAASQAHDRAFTNAIARLHQEAASAGGHGVVGVHVERSIYPSHIEVTLLGTAVRPAGANSNKSSDVFISDLSARDFMMLMTAGWQPLGLAHGASFVNAPRRTMSAALQQQSQNIELTNFTDAMYAARESAMERMQRSALAIKGTGVVEVKVMEGPMAFATHAVGFSAWGTVVRLLEDAHRLTHPVSVVTLNDASTQFDAATLS